MLTHSTLEHLKSPPESYLLPGVDIAGGIAQILDKLARGSYKTQYEWSWDIKNIFVQASDDHFSYTPALLSIFAFTSGFSIMSYSSDGISLPKIYEEDDVVKSLTDGYEPSPIKLIDGVPVLRHLEEVSFTNSKQDPDAKFNSLFATAQLANAGGGGWFTVGGYASLPDQSVVMFENGTEVSFKNYAIIMKNIKRIKNGHDLHLAYEVPKRPRSNKTTTTTSSSMPPMTRLMVSSEIKISAPGFSLTGYPKSEVAHIGEYMAGYFLDGSRSDTAVLVMLGFIDRSNKTGGYKGDLQETRRVIRKFLTQCKEAGKTKLVIDVSANGGGLAMQAWEIYKNLFPAADPWSAHRMPTTEALNFTGFWTEKTSEMTGIHPMIDNVMDASGKPFASWSDLWGPDPSSKYNETNMMYYDWSKSKKDILGFPLSGYDPDDTSAPTEALFKPRDMVILTDGICASTCSILVGLLTREQGVRTVALGGRPLQAPMQAVGGVRGMTVLPWYGFGLLAELAILYAAIAGPVHVPAAVPNLSGNTLLPGAKGGSVNLNNAYARGESNIPAQFLYEAANCRKFYTLELLSNVKNTWEAVADVAWHGAKCAPGSTVNADGTIGDTSLPYTPAVRSTLQPLNSPGSLSYHPMNGG
jgi:hypothetical protein